MKNLLAGIFVSIALITGTGCSRDETKAEAASKAPEPLVVKTVLAESRRIDRKISVTGTLTADETASVSAEVPGRVAAIHVDFGQPVRKGQVVAELDRRELQLGVERAKASLAQVLARLGLNPNQDGAGVVTTPAVRQAQAQMEDARSKFEKASQLVKTGDISRERFTELEKQYQARLALFEAAQDETRTLQANVQALRAEVELAQKRLNDATVRSPFDGAVSQKLVSVGEYLKENTPILEIVKTYPLRLRIELPESAAGSVRVGTALTFATDAAPGAEFGAIVRQLNPSLDPKSRTLTAEGRLTSTDARLRPGMFVQVDLTTQKNAEVVAVPKQALYTVAGLTKLFVVRNGVAEEKKFVPGQDLGTYVEIPREAATPGDQVAVSALTQLVHGMPVRTSGGSKG